MAAINEVTDLTLEGDVAVITLDSPPVNALSFHVRDGLFEGFKAAIADPSATAIVLICAGRTFIAGADISEFGGASKGASLFDVQAHDGELHQAGGGGHPRHRPRWRARGRVVRPLPHRRAQREVRPAGGDPRSAAGGGRHPAPAAHRRTPPGPGDDDVGHPRGGARVPRHGSVDELAGEGELRGDAIAYARHIAATGAPLAKISDRAVEPMSADEFAAFRAANAKKFRGFKAPEAIIQTVEAAVSLPFDEGMKVERELFTGLVTSAESAAQRYVFFAEREVWKIPDVPAATPTDPGRRRSASSVPARWAAASP